MNKLNWHKLILELFVVFLGISSGFVLNNWREDQKEFKLEEKYMNSFLQNLDSNIVELEDNIGEDTLWLKKAKVYIIEMSSNKFNNDSVKQAIGQIIAVSRISLQTNTYEDIKFSGNLNLIRNYNLKEKIVSYHKAIDGLNYVDGYYNSYFSDFVLPFIMNNYSLVTDDFLTENSIIYSKFYNIYAGYFSMRQQRSEEMKVLLSKSLTLKNEIKAYVNTHFLNLEDEVIDSTQIQYLKKEEN